MRASTAYNHRRFCVRFTAYRESAPADRSFPEVVSDWIRQLPPSQQGTARSALRHQFGRKAMDWAAVEIAKHKRDEGRLAAGVLTVSQRDKLREVAASPRDLALIGCLLTLRRFEVCQMLWAHINLSTGMVLVPNGKGGKASWTLLVPSTQRDLAAWFELAGQPPDNTPVFPTPRGKPYQPGSIGLIVRKLLERAGLWMPGSGCAHRFRRTLATEFLRSNPNDLKGLQQILRHESIATTAKYAWLTVDDLAPRMAQVRL